MSLTFMAFSRSRGFLLGSMSARRHPTRRYPEVARDSMLLAACSRSCRMSPAAPPCGSIPWFQLLHVGLVPLVVLTRPRVDILVSSARLSLGVGVSLGLLQVVVGQYVANFLLPLRLPPQVQDVLQVSASSEVLLILIGLGLQWCY